MFVFNGKKFAKNDSEMVDSLFQSGGTCIGFYKKQPNGIALYNLQNELTAFLVNNKYGEKFIVSACIGLDSKPFYMHSTTNQAKEWLGISDMPYGKLIETCELAIDNC